MNESANNSDSETRKKARQRRKYFDQNENESPIAAEHSPVTTQSTPDEEDEKMKARIARRYVSKHTRWISLQDLTCIDFS